MFTNLANYWNHQPDESARISNPGVTPPIEAMDLAAFPDGFTEADSPGSSIPRRTTRIASPWPWGRDIFIAKLCQVVAGGHMRIDQLN